MSMSFKPLIATPMAAVLMTTMALTGCGLFSKKKSDDDEPAAKEPKVKIGKPALDMKEGQTQGSATLSFDSDVEDATYECQIETNGTKGEWEECDAQSFSLTIQQCANYRVSVRATKDGATSKKPAVTSFSAPCPDKTQQAPTGSISLQPRSGDVVGGKTNKTAVNVSIVANGVDINALDLSCRELRANKDSEIDENSVSFSSCNGSTVFPIENLQDGEKIRLEVQATEKASGKILPVSRLQFRVELAAAGDTRDEVQAETIFSQGVQIGSFFSLQIPSDMHVTQYATTKTFSGALQYFQVMNVPGNTNSDPNYPGVNWCNWKWESIRTIAGPDAKAGVYDYCYSTPTEDLFKGMTEFRFANNHVEVATNREAVNPANHERLLVQTFDQDYEFMNSRSRFRNLCENSPIRVIANLPLIQEYYLGFLPEAAKLWYCDTIIGGQTWRVSAFFFIEGNGTYAFPDNWYQCADGCPVFRNAVEVVHMMLPNQNSFMDSQYIRHVQEMVLYNLSRTRPNGQ